MIISSIFGWFLTYTVSSKGSRNVVLPSGSELGTMEKNSALQSRLDLPEEFRLESENKPQMSECRIGRVTEKRKLGNNTVFLKKQPKCLDLIDIIRYWLCVYLDPAYFQHDGVVVVSVRRRAEFCSLLVFTEGTRGEAD